MFSAGALNQNPKFHNFEIKLCEKYPRPPEFCFNSESDNIKRKYSAIYFCSKPRAGAIMLN